MKKIIQRFPISSFFLLTCLINWLGLAGIIDGFFPPLGEFPVHLSHHLVTVFRGRQTLLSWTPNLVAILIVGVCCGRNAIGNLLKGFLRFRCGISLWAVALGLPLLAGALTVFAFLLTGQQLDLSAFQLLPQIFIVRLFFSLSTGGLGEEAGWRGLVFKTLWQRQGARKAYLLTELLWGFSHAAVWTIRVLSIEQIAWFMISILSLSVISGWLYLKSGGSLILVAMFHNLVNTVDACLSRGTWAMMSGLNFMLISAVIYTLIALIIVVKSGDHPIKQDFDPGLSEK